MTDESRLDTPKMSRGFRVVFGLSLALNFLVIAAFAGAWLRAEPPGHGFGDRGYIGRLLYKELPREDRRTLRRELRQRVDRETLRQARVGPELYAALRADPFDAQVLRELMTRQADALLTGQSAMREGWLEVLSQMTSAERAAYADRLRQAVTTRGRQAD
jgi:uncharacterized membrane protein